jgi:hypothetical protein
MPSTCHGCRYLMVDWDEKSPALKVYRCWLLPAHMILGISSPTFDEDHEQEDPEPVTSRCYRSKKKGDVT